VIQAVGEKQIFADNLRFTFYRQIALYLSLMVTRLTVIFFIVLCLEAGIFLTLLPWISFGGIGDWGDNFLLAFVAEKTGLPVLQRVVSSGWMRGAVTGLGILNLLIAFWEMANFSQTVKLLEGKETGKSHPLRVESRE